MVTSSPRWSRRAPPENRSSAAMFHELSFSAAAANGPTCVPLCVDVTKGKLRPPLPPHPPPDLQCLQRPAALWRGRSCDVTHESGMCREKHGHARGGGGGQLAKTCPSHSGPTARRHRPAAASLQDDVIHLMLHGRHLTFDLLGSAGTEFKGKIKCVFLEFLSFWFSCSSPV